MSAYGSHHGPALIETCLEAEADERPWTNGELMLLIASACFLIAAHRELAPPTPVTAHFMEAFSQLREPLSRWLACVKLTLK